jgi:hypothetical protein
MKKMIFQEEWPLLGRGDNLIVFHYLSAFELRPYKRGGLSWRGETI